MVDFVAWTFLVAALPFGLATLATAVRIAMSVGRSARPPRENRRSP
jgi:hypothetical protein